jgi:hypothetical protein
MALNAFTTRALASGLQQLAGGRTVAVELVEASVPAGPGGGPSGRPLPSGSVYLHTMQACGRSGNPGGRPGFPATSDPDERLSR